MARGVHPAITLGVLSTQQKIAWILLAFLGYGTGAIKLTEDNEVIRAGSVEYTIKDGIVYDARALLADVKRMVDEAKEKEQYEIDQPGEFRH